MTLAEFVTQHVGHFMDYDGALGPQCCDLVNEYDHDVIGGAGLAGNAKDFFGQQIEKYTWVLNTPSGVPPIGSILVWNKNVGGGYGDVAIALDGCTLSTLNTLSQNVPYESPTHLQMRTYANLIGWGIPRNNVLKNTDEQKNCAGVWQALRLCNVRTAPRINAPLGGSRQLLPGQTFDAVDVVVGDAVASDCRWVKSTRGNYVWAGNITRIA